MTEPNRLTTPHCILCGRPEDEVTPSFSWYLSSVGASRCPECGAPQGADLVDRAEVEGALADLRAEVAALREACTLALGIMEQKNRVAVLPTAKFVDVKFAPEDIAVLRAALEKK